MGCNCGRRAVVRQSPGPSPGTEQPNAEALVAAANAQNSEITMTSTDPATGTITPREDT